MIVAAALTIATATTTEAATTVSCWLGVDVGASRKGFDAALIDRERVLGLWSQLDCDGIGELVETHAPELVAIDSPCSCGQPGERTREGERLLNRAVCGIRWTPDRAEVEANPYYGWVVEGLRLYEALAERDVPTIEVFPTATWTRLAGPRGGASRSAWSTAALAALGLGDLPARMNQDARDAIGAAITARLHADGRTDSYGEIVVPTAGARAGRRRPAAPPPRPCTPGRTS